MLKMENSLWCRLRDLPTPFGD